MDEFKWVVIILMYMILATAHACVRKNISKKFVYVSLIIIAPIMFSWHIYWNNGFIFNVLLFFICTLLFWIFELAMKGIVRKEGSMWLSVCFGVVILIELKQIMFLDVYVVSIMLWISFFWIYFINAIILLRYAKQYNSFVIYELQKIFWVLQMILMISSIYYGFLNDPYSAFFVLYRLEDFDVTWDCAKSDNLINIIRKLKKWWCLINKLEYRLIFYKNIGINWNVFNGFCLFLLLLLQKELLKFLLIFVQWYKDRKLIEFGVKFFGKLNLLLFVVFVVMFFFL